MLICDLNKLCADGVFVFKIKAVKSYFIVSFCNVPLVNPLLESRTSLY